MRTPQDVIPPMMTETAIVMLCAVGLYASVYMWRKALRAERGGLTEPSVVQSDRARALGTPNAALGCVYYVALATMTLATFFGMPLVWWLTFAAALAAAMFSLYLAYSLLFVTRMPCVYCWTSHAVNWCLVALLLFARPHA